MAVFEHQNLVIFNVALFGGVAPSWPGVVRWELGRGLGGGVLGGGALVPFLDFRVPDSDFRKHRRAMTGMAEPGGASLSY